MAAQYSQQVKTARYHCPGTCSWLLCCAVPGDLDLHLTQPLCSSHSAAVLTMVNRRKASGTDGGRTWAGHPASQCRHTHQADAGSDEHALPIE